jgi:hypothetical protein
MNAYFILAEELGKRGKLAFGWMLKTAVLDSTKQLRLEQEVSEPGAVDPNVAPDGFNRYETDRSSVWRKLELNLLNSNLKGKRQNKKRSRHTS